MWQPTVQPLRLLLALLLFGSVVRSETTTPSETIAGGDLSYFYARGNASRLNAPSLKTKQCVGVIRGLFRTAGVHLEPRFEAVGVCPSGTPADLVDLCATDVYNVPPEAGPLVEIENHMVEAFRSGEKPVLSQDVSLSIRKVSPVFDNQTETVYANIYCAKCHLQDDFKRVQQLPRKMLCDRENGAARCFVLVEPPEIAVFCPLERPGPRSSFDWDSIFVLPSDDEMFGPEAEDSPTDQIFTILQWILTGFSLVALLIALLVFSCSERLRRPLPGKMMIGLCSALLFSLLAFLLASGVMELIKAVFHIGLRPICMTFAALLQFFLLSAFVWMALFAVELFRTFGLTRMMRSACCKRRDDGAIRNTKQKASGMMLRARRREYDSTSQITRHLAVAGILPLCFTIPAIAINEHAYTILAPIYAAADNSTWRNISKEAALGPVLNRLNPGFCPFYDARHAWFTGHQTALFVWFLAPAGCMIVFNLVALFIVCVQICRLKKETQLSPGHAEETKRHSRSLVGVCIKLAIILGASWFVQLFAGLRPELEMIRRVAGLMNSAQGGVIAISMLVGSKARRVMAMWLPTRCREALGVSDSNSRYNDVAFSSRSRDNRNLLTSSSKTTSLASGNMARV